MRVVMDEKDNAAATMEVMITVTDANDADPGRFRAVMPLGVNVSIYEYGPTRQAASEACAKSAMKLLSLDIGAPSGNILNVPHIAKDRDFREAIIACDKLLTTKGNDYTQGAEGDYGRLKNFYTSADAFKSLTPYTCLGVLFKKHIDAIYTFLDKGRVESEPIEGRIHDAINYLLLAYKMVQYEKRKSNGKAVPVAVVDNQGLVK